jgi:arylsulfatase A-like enzyme
MAALGRGAVDDAWNLEGRDIWPLLSGQGDVAETVLYWKYYNGQRAAVRSDNWKLIIDRRDNSNELFDMTNDPYESLNLAEKHPGRIRELTALLQQQAKLDRD